jgi:SAM-dependent methyltransferase
MIMEVPDIETSSDNYAKRFSGKAGEYFLKIQTDNIKRVLGDFADYSILEVGGGHGQLVPMFLSQRCKLMIYGSDNSCHERIRLRFSNEDINFITGDILNLPFSDESFDLVVSVRLISHVYSWQKLVEEFCRVSRRTIIIDYPNIVSLNSLTPLLFSLKKKIEGNTRTYNSFLRKDLKKQFQKNGYCITKVENQFFLPMVLHRALRAAYFLRVIELILYYTGVTKLFGSPAILRADKIN